MAKFLTDLDVVCIDDGKWRLASLLEYRSDLVGLVQVPTGFETDFASVPRVPVAFTLFGNRAHREAVLHDAMYRIDFPGNISYNTANKVFLEAMGERGKPFYIRYPMYLAVCLGGWTAWHKKRLMDPL